MSDDQKVLFFSSNNPDCWKNILKSKAIDFRTLFFGKGGGKRKVFHKKDSNIEQQ